MLFTFKTYVYSYGSLSTQLELDTSYTSDCSGAWLNRSESSERRSRVSHVLGCSRVIHQTASSNGSKAIRGDETVRVSAGGGLRQTSEFTRLLLVIAVVIGYCCVVSVDFLLARACSFLQFSLECQCFLQWAQ